MSLTSSVSFEGLTKMIADFRETIPQRCSSTLAEWTLELGQELADLYRENLSGSVPSTDASPLPVGMRTGDLLAGVTLNILNQYAFEVKNDVPYAGFIEDGTVNMAPRMPLQNAVDQQAAHMQTDADNILVEIMSGSN